MALHFDGFTLRLAQASDVDAFAAIWADPQVTRYLPSRGGPIPRKRVEQVLIKYEQAWQEHSHGVWTIVEDTTQRMIGYGGLRTLDDLGEVEVLYGLAATHWSGIATQTAQEALKHGFDVIGLKRIIALTVPENLASRRVIEKAGLKYEKQMHAFGLDLLLYSLHAHKR